MKDWQFVVLVVAICMVLICGMFVWAAVKVSARADRRMEQMREDMRNDGPWGSPR